jgi:hypothetical protein
MAPTHEPFPVKYFIAILYSDPAAVCNALDSVKAEWGAIDFTGNEHLFDVTDYYVPEMGSPIYRKIVSFETLRSPLFVVDMKLRCNELELSIAIDNKRNVNLDAGYLDHNKVLLASAKEAGQKVYLDKGIYADLAGRYKNGKYQPFEWSFPDFKDGRYDSELISIRAKYMKQMKEWRDKTNLS